LTLVACAFTAPLKAEDTKSRQARQQATEEWYEAQQEVIEELADRDVIEWSNRLAAELPKADRRTLFVTLDVFIRAGHQHRVPDVVRWLCGLELPTIIHKYIAEERLIANELWDSLRILLDTHRDFYPVYFHKYRTHWWANGDRAELERWLKDRYEADWRSWHRDYYWVLIEQDKMAALVAELRERVPQHPGDGQLAFEYLAAARALAAVSEAPHNKPDVAWLGEIVRPRYAMDAFDLAGALAEWQHPAEAIRLFDYSLARPITDYDREALQQRCSKLFVEGEHEPTIRRWTKAGLARSCMKGGELKRAQQLAEELVGPGATFEDLGTIRLAGDVQRASGQRVIEGRIKRAETEKKDSIRYWMGRAQYYIGRQETERAEEAYRKALALPPGDSRHPALLLYVGFLRRQERHQEAAELLRKELQRIGPKHGSAEFLVRQIIYTERRHEFGFSADDPLLWRFLAERADYDYTEQDVLRALLEKARAADGEQAFWERAVKLAGPGSDPRQGLVVGQLLLHQGDADRAVPLLRDAFDRWEHESLQERFASSLIDAYVKTGDWRSAEKVFRRVRGRLVEIDVRQRLADLAVAAASHGSRDDSLRLWKERANLDMNDLDKIDRMAAAGMAVRLQAFYQKLDKRDPDNRAVAVALEVLGSQ